MLPIATWAQSVPNAGRAPAVAATTPNGPMLPGAPGGGNGGGNGTLGTAAAIPHFFAVNLYDPSNVVGANLGFKFAPTTPGTFAGVGTVAFANLIGGGTYANGVWYGIEYNTGYLYAIDTTTLNRINPPVDTLSGSPNWIGLAWLPGTDTMYVAGSDGVTTLLYCYKMTTEVLTQVGTLTTGTEALVIGLGCDSLGNLYGQGLATDQLYRMNRFTGATMQQAVLGFDANYAQDLDVDIENSIGYIAAYNNTAAAGQLYSFNLTTLAVTLVGNFQGNAEIGGFAIPTNPPPVVCTLSVSISADTTCVGSATTFTQTTTGASANAVYEIDYESDGIYDAILNSAPTFPSLYATAGTFTAKFRVTDGPCADSATVDVLVLPQPTFALTSDTVCQGTETVFELTPPVDPTTGVLWDFGDVGLPPMPSTWDALHTHTYADSGTFNVSVDLSGLPNGCIATASGTALVIHNPPVSVTIQDNGSGLSILSLTPADATLQWYGPLGLIPGATTSTLLLEPGEDGEYYVVAINPTACGSDTSNTIFWIFESTADAVAASPYTLYPNPSTGQFSLRIPTGMPAPTAFTAINALGQAVRTCQVAPGATDLNLSGLAPGTYTLWLNTPQGAFRHRVLLLPN